MWPQGEVVLLDVCARFAVTTHQRVPSYMVYANICICGNNNYNNNYLLTKDFVL